MKIGCCKWRAEEKVELIFSSICCTWCHRSLIIVFFWFVMYKWTRFLGHTVHVIDIVFLMLKKKFLLEVIAFQGESKVEFLFQSPAHQDVLPARDRSYRLSKRILNIQPCPVMFTISLYKLSCASVGGSIKNILFACFYE